MEDNALVNAYLSGDYAAFVTLYDRHKGGVYRYVKRQLDNPSKTDDVFQDIWAKVIKRLDSFAHDASFSTWLYTIARNSLIDEVRHMRVVDKTIDESVSSDNVASITSIHSPRASHTNVLKKQAINECINQLPLHQKDCFLLKEESGLTASEIASIVDAGLEATKSRLRSAYKNLRHCLQPKLGFTDGANDLEQGA
ncbi:MAG: sigma-70 family RNA polymerase sigma factor [Pseudomonadota bacterium]